ncbi:MULTISPECIES: aldolase/citrate lyase family protein [Sinorhizobium]|uniref:2-keto-3-deoxy-L-rhamnonate aldolase n=2 Tax=Sinorhizobium TaxID=28105 RepID=A0A2S3YIC9_9HYPH|nr:MULTISPECIES: HpcH/HpaI aldolase/citrate lyase family protein [Sinorhizobium]ASY58698.1 2,4-dihydroxyhept-2-ene-1,7-dioic acid aldolase [Sinorhizobium sp. CCBAU 05631]AUX74637.1 2,4-dihydroxyhept-2-ene-1,7-dioic acid aldolase 1 [Sinorhizobium fredii]PDT40894.1 2-keto-3-deoxy-L-rhamnonate aldolase [Sinorhizobium sp. FG01]POH26729.1 2-keto-3-deoxy-L-rhamnonate aldolase [Sinorhizobium americanum]
MPAPKNPFKAAIRASRFQLGLWVALASPYAAEVVAGSGYDWLLIDGEHAPNDLPLLAAQYRAIAGRGSHPIVRLPVGDTALIKQVLDTGVQTLLIPMVDTVAQARQLVRAVRYPPHGIRGVGAALGRATNFGRITDYLQNANDEICLILQIESRAGLAAIDEIAALDGVDGLFIGPSDLAADMGHLGNPAHPDVRDAIVDGFARIHKAGKARGILTLDPVQARDYRALGADFMAIGTDVTLLVSATEQLRREYLGEVEPARTESGY